MKTFNLRFVVLTALLAAFPIVSRAQTIYTLGVPDAPTIFDTTDPSRNAWVASNAPLPAVSGLFSMDHTPGYSALDVAGAQQVLLSNVVSGFTVERIKPEFWIGSEIIPPANVDWTATYLEYQNSAQEQASFLFDPKGERLFAIIGGTHKMRWVLKSGAVQENSYVVGSVCEGRPYRIFWTQAPYNAPKVDLSGKFVRFFGNREITEKKLGTVTNIVGGSEQIVENAVVRGLYIDPASGLLSVYGELSGQVVMAYYDTGDYDTIKHVQVVEVCRPEVVNLTGEIGVALRPSGSGYGISRLVAMPQATSATDDRGDYYYQHKGNYSYSPKSGEVYPLRPTVDEPWRLPVYWMEYDPYDTVWPFELCHYECDWGENAQIFVRGNVNGESGKPLVIPESYVATLMNYQDPEGHAQAPVNREFSTTGAGYSLLKLTTDDNVWFLPIRSVERDDPNYFTLEPADWNIGSEIRPRGNGVSGFSSTYSPTIDLTIPGYIYPETSGKNYNPNLYYVASTMDSETSVTNVVSGGDTNVYPSVIYPVTTDTKDLEVWWSSCIRKSDMPEALQIPSAVQVYHASWPGPGDLPQIVLASQKGTSETTFFGEGRAAYLNSSEAQITLPSRIYFSSNSFSVAFKMFVDDPAKAMGPETNLLFSLAAEDGNAKNGAMAVTLANGTFGLSVYNGRVFEVDLGKAQVGDWCDYVITSDAKSTRFYSNGTLLSETNMGLSVSVPMKGMVGGNATWIRTVNVQDVSETFQSAWNVDSSADPGGAGQLYTATLEIPLNHAVFGGHQFERFRFSALMSLADSAVVRVSSPAGSIYETTLSFADGAFDRAFVLSNEASALSLTVSALGNEDDLALFEEDLQNLTMAFEEGWAPKWRTAPGVAGVALDDIAFYDVALPATHTLIAKPFSYFDNDEMALTLLLLFDQEEDLAYIPGSTYRKAKDLATGLYVDADNIMAMDPGSKKPGTGVIVADEMPTIYTQPDVTKTGYNPNEEHAFVQSGSGGYVVYAFRMDLNTKETSEPFVLVEYKKNGAKKMSCFSVLLTNEVYTSLSGTAIVGNQLPGPHPFDLLENPWLPETYWNVNPFYAETVRGTNQTVVIPSSAYRDRKGQLWARAPGVMDAHMYYRNQEGFDYPSLATAPAVGDPIPWLSSLGKTPDTLINKKPPAPWTWTVTWPSETEIMRIGQTLTTASGGLPEVWNASSMAVVYPTKALGDPSGGDVVRLYDPTVIQSTGSSEYKTVSDLLAAFGFKVGENLSLKEGKYYFEGVPPTLSSRFYVNANQSVDSCVCLQGTLEEKTGGTSILYVNVLTDGERTGLKSIMKVDTMRSKWDALIDSLATNVVLPVAESVASSPLHDQNGAVTGFTTNQLNLTYSPVDHYALTAVGGVGYVVLVENDSPDKKMVSDGDPISMHVFCVTNEYYLGKVVTREDPKNLLSEKLDVLYTEALAGRAGDFNFEWRKARPRVNGEIPTDYENEFSKKFPDGDTLRGLTRFTLGAQGDTLVDLVNTYYVVRYQARPGTAAYATMKDTWSSWCGPALAEGWVQRSLNNVTPFTQRMQDLYENAAETHSSMLVAAGGPYEGDVALNQDNLTNVGLIQLYQTILNKAESMSLSLGINDTDANKQLMLAVDRLGDLYGVLGDEAYTDAKNPTIGFGLSFDNYAPGILMVDYGAESSSLFCFDNQVNTLLDEELALLRGRTGEDAPVVTTAPYYNRLVWNFTKGITAGEVAYQVNYNINSANGDALVDEQDAAAQFPQGHGDAWGHYLSAVSGWYRLLRNPNFSWGQVSKGEMVVNDAVVNIDYYEESKFAESANKLAKAGYDIVDLTARKALRDTGARQSGYQDQTADRAFGYGEWATRTGIGGMVNWMVANSLLPEKQVASDYYVLRFTGNTALSVSNAPNSLTDNGTDEWTLEAQFSPQAGLKNASLFSFAVEEPVDDEKSEGHGASLEVRLDENGALGYRFVEYVPIEVTNQICLAAYKVWYTPEGAGTPIEVIVPDMVDSALADQIPQKMTFTEIPLISEDKESIETVQIPGGIEGTLVTNLLMEVIDSDRLSIPYETVRLMDALPSGGIFALDRASDGKMRIRMVVNGIVVCEKELEGTEAIPRTNAKLTFGGAGYIGHIAEIRLWSELRSVEMLEEYKAQASQIDPLLRSYFRLISDSDKTTVLADEVNDNLVWNVDNPQWDAYEKSGVEIQFYDEGLLRIDRSTVTALPELATQLDAVQAKVRTLDAGMNPVGLNDDAIPFDITPIGADTGESSHFEQIYDRAKVALANAGKVLDRAQTLGNRLRSVQNSTTDVESEASSLERSYNSQLIEIFGYPFAGDIGPSGTYKQGYDGPDLIHFMWMDLSAYGLDSVDSSKEQVLVRYEVPMWSLSSFIVNYINKEATNVLEFALSSGGLVSKPSTVTGRRRANGRIQDAYGNFLSAYAKVDQAILEYERVKKMLEAEATAAEIALAISQIKFAVLEGLNVKTLITKKTITALKTSLFMMKYSSKAIEDGEEDVVDSIPTIVGAGLTVNTDPRAFASAALTMVSTPLGAVRDSVMLSLQTTINALEDSSIGDFISTMLTTAGDFSSEKTAIRDRLLEWVDKERSCVYELQNAWIDMVNAWNTVDSTLAEGERLLNERKAARTKVVNRISKLAYSDMLLRQLRNEALSRYTSSFDLAQKYAFLAAKAYDYQTGLLTADSVSGKSFISEILGSRSLGTLVDGEPLLADGVGDPGLADIMARLQANWQVVKPRLGINNPQRDATWFSLRKEFFRNATDADWRTELARYAVEDLRNVPEYQRYCQPFASTDDVEKEAGFVIPFSTTIDFAQNFFGKSLQGGDHAFDSTYYATRIAGAGVQFVGYNQAMNGYSGETALSATPVVYLIPIGIDRIRMPGSAEGTVLDYHVVDQVIPLPFAIGSTELDDPDWLPLYNGDVGGADVMTKIRKHPSFRVSSEANDDALACTRLIGRSVWNTQWVLIIPAGAMHSDREKAMEYFLRGADLNRDGKTDLSPVTDIQFGFKTYSTSGN